MSQATLLIVEDDPDISFILCECLKKAGHRVLTAKSAEEGVELARRRQPDLMVVDIMLPKMDGLELVRVLRQESEVPVILLTAKSDEVDRILGLKLGADDYIVKPFSVAEVASRVKAILRRTAPAARGRGGKLRVGGIEMDFDRHEVTVNGRSPSLSPREFQLLRLLVEAQGRALSREILSKTLWGEDRSSEIDVRTVDQHIARLRKKLQGERHRIATVSHFGYQFKSSEESR
ncbi:MAG: response regulator transcription factor [Elusimicrobia bacterium]|nr:response regulator transcription factor [Elusimicrobiota bacterium]